MSLPTLEEIFSQLAVEQDTAAISREIADLIRDETMQRTQFRVLYRHFLFRPRTRISLSLVGAGRS